MDKVYEIFHWLDICFNCFKAIISSSQTFFLMFCACQIDSFKLCLKNPLRSFNPMQGCKNDIYSLKAFNKTELFHHFKHLFKCVCVSVREIMFYVQNGAFK